MSPFALKVYKVVLNIPFGEVRTYRWVAEKAGHPGAWRAVGRILKNNPLPLIIPCHRVICSDKDLGGYIWGRKIKKLLINYERKLKELMV
ncbi:MAG: MGMT family protein [Candidatus Omnitrophica bacterium]|nr:MGMT family protein [Candidatus Omnitrophota bacterium]MCM8800034.1 MGMT family protein [Candidatus Omnitrophota bacterium]